MIDASGGFYAGHAAAGMPLDDERHVPAAERRADRRSSSSGAKQRGMTDLKGHRSVGGIRASIYNAMPVAGVEKLRDFMIEFREQNE